MRRLVICALVGFAASTSGVSTLSAQETPLPTGERLRLLFTNLEPMDEVQIVTPSHFVEHARFGGVDGASVTVLQDGATVPLELVDIRAVSLRSNHQWQGALWGLGSGVLVGSVTGMMIASFGCVTATGCNNSERQGALLWGAVLGVTGAATGFAIGRTSVYWRPLFP